MMVKTKEAVKIRIIISNMNRKSRIRKLIMDNSKKFINNELREWAENSNVKIEYAIPYFHVSNGRVEKANPRIREAL